MVNSNVQVKELIRMIEFKPDLKADQNYLVVFMNIQEEHMYYS